jgi:hypothetical protein
MGAAEDRREWVAAVPWSAGTGFAGRLSKVGGTLVLTADAVAFKPFGGIGRRRTVPLGDVAEVAPVADMPPRLRITLRDGDRIVLMVMPSRTSTSHSGDTSARDDAIAAISARLR